ncbi:MAG: class I SAM-dependent methyltransferase, partial [Elusimicrobiota bacterium]|nr:class I SAM-dependent methyltransferase [Elusimicrobiota bacterium]
RRRDAAADRRLGLRAGGARARVTVRVEYELEPGARVGRHDDDAGYGPTDYRRLGLLADALRPGPSDAFLDLGCGAGRVLCFMSAAGAGRCVGVELDPHALAAARANAAATSARTGRPVEVHEADAAALPAELADAATLVFLYNPFGVATLRDALRALDASRARRPRALTLAYYNPVHRRLLDGQGWLAADERLMDAANIGLWRSRP